MLRRARDDRWEQEMSNPTRIGQEAPDLKTPSSPSRITPTRALDDDADDDDESFHTASALTPSSMASLPA